MTRPCCRNVLALHADWLADSLFLLNCSCYCSAEKKAEEVKDATSGYLQKAKENLSGLWHHASEKTQEGAEQARQTAAQASNTAAAKAQESGDAANAALKDTYNSASSKAREARDKTLEGAAKARDAASGTASDAYAHGAKVGDPAYRRAREGAASHLGGAPLLVRVATRPCLTSISISAV